MSHPAAKTQKVDMAGVEIVAASYSTARRVLATQLSSRERRRIKARAVSSAEEGAQHLEFLGGCVKTEHPSSCWPLHRRMATPKVISMLSTRAMTVERTHAPSLCANWLCHALRQPLPPLPTRHVRPRHHLAIHHTRQHQGFHSNLRRVWFLSSPTSTPSHQSLG